MTARRPSFASNRRPSSAIFIGPDSLPPLPSPPSPAHSSSSNRSQLPSPPATNSTGSIGDSNSTSAGSVRRSGMVNGDRHSSHSDDDDDNELEHDEDDTAKLSNERRGAKGKQTDFSSSTLQRVKSLTERNRKVIDKLSSITSDTPSRSSLSTPSGPSSSRSRSPLPPTFSSSSSSSAASTHSRVSFARSLRGGSGSETEREQQPRPVSRDRDNSLSSEDNDVTTPPASARRPTPLFDRLGPRQRLRSAPSSPAKPPSALTPPSPRKQASTSFAIIGSGRRSRRVSIQQPDELEENEEALNPPPTAGGSGNKKFRAPLPREFRDRRSLDGRSVGESSTQALDGTPSPGVLVARGSASPHSSGAGGTFSNAPTSPRAQRPARPSTVRETSKRMHRWNSVDEASLNGSSPGDDDGRRQWRHAGSAESPLGGREGRSVVGEGLRAAGLARRGSEDVFADGVPQRRTRLSGGLGNRPTLNGRGDGDLDELRRGIARVGLGLPDLERDTRTPASTGRFSSTRNIQSVLSGTSSRAATSLASYGGDEESTRTAPPLRSYRSSYVLPERTNSRQTPQHERSRTSPAAGAFGRTTPQHTTSSVPSSEHARLMLDSLAMFESQLARLPPAVPDLARAAQSVVQSANGLNTLLRSGNARALEAQIEAEVGDAAEQVDASEVWRQVGGEYRESLRVSDELVRTVTALLLGVGRLVREAAKERGAGSPDQGGGGSGRSSLDGDEREREKVVRGPRRSVEGDGRSSVEGSMYRESRRSWEDAEGSRRGRVDLNSRPSTSLSMVRDRDRDRRQDDGDETARERERSSALERLSIRRVFSPRSRDTIHASPASQDSPDPSYPSPSPAPRSSLDRDHHRSLPPLAVPPPLPSLPSESLLERKSSSKGRRGKFSNTSNATVRGTFFPALNTPNPTTALSTHTVSAAGEVTAFPLVRADSSPSTALSGLQQQQQRDVRKRTLSSASARDVEGASGSSGSSGTRALRGTRVRMSLDSAELEAAPPEHHAPVPPPAVNGDRRERRRTINEIFPS